MFYWTSLRISVAGRFVGEIGGPERTVVPRSSFDIAVGGDFFSGIENRSVFSSGARWVILDALSAQPRSKGVLSILLIINGTLTTTRFKKKRAGVFCACVHEPEET
jgi:hypothetical protein